MLTVLKALVAGATFWRVANIAREDLRTLVACVVRRVGAGRLSTALDGLTHVVDFAGHRADVGLAV